MTKLTVPEQKNVLQSNDEDVSTPSISTSQRRKKKQHGILFSVHEILHMGRTVIVHIKDIFQNMVQIWSVAQKLQTYSQLVYQLLSTAWALGR